MTFSLSTPHPYRDGNLTVFEDAVHGSEIINGNPRHDNHNDLARSVPPPPDSTGWPGRSRTGR